MHCMQCRVQYHKQAGSGSQFGGSRRCLACPLIRDLGVTWAMQKGGKTMKMVVIWLDGFGLENTAGISIQCWERGTLAMSWVLYVAGRRRLNG